MRFLIFVILCELSVCAHGKVKDDPLSCSDVEVVSRQEWHARSPDRQRAMFIPINHVVIIHTVTDFCSSKSQCIRSIQLIQEIHLDDRGWWDIAYNFLIGGDGRVYVGRGWNSTGAHSINYNFNSVGVAFIGNFEKNAPTRAMVDASLRLLDCGVAKGYLTPTYEVHGHKDVSCTQSPGANLYEVIRNWDHYKGGRLKNFNCQPLEPPVLNEEIIDHD